MLKHTVTYTNIDGVEVQKDLYFNLGANEILEKESLSGDTYAHKLEQIAESDKLSEIYPTILEFIQSGYGVRTEDGEFFKDDTGADWKKFKSSLPFQALMDNLLMDPSNNGNRLAEFITGMLPKELANKINESNSVPGFRPGADTGRPTPPIQAPVVGNPGLGEPAPLDYRQDGQPMPYTGDPSGNPPRH